VLRWGGAFGLGLGYFLFVGFGLLGCFFVLRWMKFSQILTFINTKSQENRIHPKHSAYLQANPHFNTSTQKPKSKTPT
jgi:hypothetical protein